MKKYNDGFHVVAGYYCIIENGYIQRVRINEEKGIWGVPFIPSKYGGYDNAYMELTPAAFAARVKRGTVVIA